MTTKNSCYQILDILLEIPNFDINQRNQDCQTPLTLALGKRDYKSIMILFKFPNLELYEPDFDMALESMQDIDILIDECFKAYRETGYNFSDAVDFLTEYKRQVRPECIIRQFFEPRIPSPSEELLQQLLGILGNSNPRPENRDRKKRRGL